MAPLLVFIRKDLRLLARDRAALMFILLAPLIVICVAGFSLANLYGADPLGQTAYDLPVLDEDGSPLARQIRERLAGDPAVRVHEVHSRAEAQAAVRDKRAGSALVIPHGTAAALAQGRSATLILYNDPVKYLERINLRTRILELRDAIAADQAAEVRAAAATERARAEARLRALRTTIAAQRATLEAAWRAAQRARAALITTARQDADRARAEAAQRVKRALQQQAGALRGDVQRQSDQLRAEFRAYADALTAARAGFAAWLADLKRRAGSHAGDIPPPPAFPDLPPGLQQILDGRRAPLELRLPDLDIALPAGHVPEVPSLPELPPLELPDLVLPALPAAPAALDIEVVNLTGGVTHINTFDQNVPGFAVTFLMLGMLLGISLGLLDEREWGTFERMRALPVGPSHFLLAKLLTRFLVGVVQMIILLAIGWLAFGVSLGPQPAALLLPIAGIAFAGTAFGLLVAAVTRSRETVFSVGSVVMVTMAAVGGCWWPIDLEPRWMRSVALAFPTTWAMDAFNDLMIRRRSAEAAVLPTAVMFAYGLLSLALGLVIFRRRTTWHAR
jgi:ABC-type multidrug transport system permease subunit